MNCKNCSVEINNKNTFCSRSCAASFNNKKKPKRRPEGRCVSCDCPIKSSAKYCSECYKSVYINIELKKPRKHHNDFKVCSICSEEHSIDKFYKSRSSCKKCFSQYVKGRQNDIKNKCVQYKGGMCEKCGYNKCISALEFHHLDPKEKDINISGIKSMDFDKYKAELDKCILLCANCHREIHFNA